MSEEHFRIRCKCGDFIDSKVLSEKIKANHVHPKLQKDTINGMLMHMKHMFGGDKMDLYSIKLNGEIQAMDYHTAFDEEFIIEEVKGIMKKSEPDDVIEIINVSKNESE